MAPAEDADPRGPFRLDGEDVLATVRVTPRGGRDGVDGLVTLGDGRRVLAVRVRAVPEDGAANAAVAALVAGLAGLPKSRARVEAGQKARVKTVRLEGAGAAGLSRLAAAAGG